MSTLFVKVLRQAFKTFDRSNQNAFSTNFTLLKQLTEQLTFRDIHVNQQLFAENIFDRPGKAPCTFVHIFENANVSMGVFVMRSGYTMPLHDHPMMHGILRGLHGKLKVLSYTQQYASNASEKLIYDKTAREIDVIAEEHKFVSPETECAILTPRERNFHEITAVDGVAAFFDILSPPYDTNIPIYGKRKCRFYQTTPLDLESQLLVDDDVELTEVKKNEAQVIEPGSRLKLYCIPAPDSYYCDTAEAADEVIESTFICSAEAYSS